MWHVSRWSSIVTASLAAVVAVSTVDAQSGATAVDTRSNLFLAGGNLYGFSPTGGTGLVPTAIALTAGTGRVLQLSATGSSFFCNAVSCATTTPDGPALAGTNVSGTGLIGGIASPSSGFLAALFLGPTLPATQPAQFVVSDIDATSYTPGLGQAFFVGDGATSGGVMQQFLVPDGATQLYFGIADGPAFSGPPEFYDDNLGTYSVEYAVSGASSVPEPVTASLVTLGLLGLWATRRRRTH